MWCSSKRASLLRLAALSLAAPALGTASLSGCGFQLRVATQLPFRTLYTNFPATSALGVEFKRTIRQQGDITLVDTPDKADARLDVEPEIREKEIVAFSSTGRPREYQIRLRLRYRVLNGKGSPLTESTDIALRRDITTTDSQLIAKQQEEVLLYREMQSDMVLQLIRRLAAVRVI
jgi:LPS-assembly lipoprotein